MTDSLSGSYLVGAGRPTRLKPVGPCARAVSAMRGERLAAYDPRADGSAHLGLSLAYNEAQRAKEAPPPAALEPLPRVRSPPRSPPAESSRPLTAASRPQSPSLPLELSSKALGLGLELV